MDQVALDLSAALKDRVGGFFHNTRDIAGVTCRVCSGPGSPLCGPCREQQVAFGDQLADRVLTLAYATGNAPQYHQSAFHMRAYKQPGAPSEKARDDLALMVVAASYIHGRCVGAASPAPWNAVTFIPSVTRPGPTHPVADLARRVYGLAPDRRFLLDLGPTATDPSRSVRRDTFRVSEQWSAHVRGAHVLVVDDTWTTGSKAQSAALAVRAAGAAFVTVLCVARWCRYDWPDHRALLALCPEPYDASICPVTRGLCAA